MFIVTNEGLEVMSFAQQESALRDKAYRRDIEYTLADGSTQKLFTIPHVVCTLEYLCNRSFRVGSTLCEASTPRRGILRGPALK
jgi:hypothetical protein